MILISFSDGRNVQKGTRSHAGEPSARKEAQAGSQEEEVSICPLVSSCLVFSGDVCDFITDLEAYCFWLV